MNILCKRNKFIPLRYNNSNVIWATPPQKVSQHSQLMRMHRAERRRYDYQLSLLSCLRVAIFQSLSQLSICDTDTGTCYR